MRKRIFQQTPTFLRFCQDLEARRPDMEAAENFARYLKSEHEQRGGNGAPHTYRNMRGKVFQSIVLKSAEAIAGNYSARLPTDDDLDTTFVPYRAYLLDGLGYTLCMSDIVKTEIDVPLITDSELWILEAKLAKEGEPISLSRLRALSKIFRESELQISYAVVTRPDIVSEHLRKIEELRRRRNYPDMIATSIPVGYEEFFGMSDSVFGRENGNGSAPVEEAQKLLKET